MLTWNTSDTWHGTYGQNDNPVIVWKPFHQEYQQSTCNGHTLEKNITTQRNEKNERPKFIKSIDLLTKYFNTENIRPR